MDLDNIDRQLISMLQVDGRRSYTSIASELGVSEGAIRYRAQRLTKSGIIQIVAVTDPLRVGYDLLTMVDVCVRAGMVEAVTDRMCEIDAVNWVTIIAGDAAQIRCEILSQNTEHLRKVLHEEIEAIDGILSMQTTMITKIHKTNLGWGIPMIETPGTEN